MVKLSERLSAVSKLITPTLKVADVGCDHGYLSIYLLQNNITDKVIASDVRKGPLSKASENVKLYGLNDKIELRLSDGLTNYKTGEVESVVMSGMGGNLMIKILEESKEIIESVKELILQPQSEVAGLRHYLSDNGFMIISESIVYEDFKYYPMMKAVHDKMNWDREVYYKYGKILLKEQDPILHQYLIAEKDYYVNLYSELCCQSPTENVIARLKDVEEMLKYNNEALEIIDSESEFEIERVIT